MRAGQWDDAVAGLRRVLASGPGPADRIVGTQLLGWALLGSGRFDAVAELVNRERFNQVEVATLGAVNRLAQGDPGAVGALASALGDESVDPPSWAAGFLSNSPDTIDDLAASVLALPEPQGTAAVGALVDWLARAELHAESLTVAARAAQDKVLAAHRRRPGLRSAPGIPWAARRRRPVGCAGGQPPASIATRVKWHRPATMVKECQTSWYPNTRGDGLGRPLARMTAPTV